MRRTSAQHGFVESESPGVCDGFQQQEILVCPKPRRATASLPEFLCPLACNHSCTRGSNVLELISGKKSHGRESVCTGCPPCRCGSPPSRSDNPLVHDIEFAHQKEHVKQLQQTKLSDKLGFKSAP